MLDMSISSATFFFFLTLLLSVYPPWTDTVITGELEI